MTRLIDANALITAVLKKAIDDAFLNGNTDMHRLLVQVVAHQPTIDAVPVIRCEDCIHHHGYICDRLYGLQDAFTLQDDDFCSKAEQKGKQ
jgi:hypothetical protein